MQRVLLPRPTVTDCVGTIVSSVFLTPTIKAIRLRLNLPEFSFLPGQSIWPRFERNGKQFQKIYSIASSPSQCPEVELCVSRVGWSSAYLQDLEVGETISARGPYGLLTLDGLPSRPRLYVAEGSGIAPIKSQIDWLADCGFKQPIWLIQSNPETPDCLPYQELWRSLAQRWHSFHYIEAITASPERLLAQQPLNLAQFDIDICSINDRPAQLQSVVLALGARPGHVRLEEFVAF